MKPRILLVEDTLSVALLHKGYLAQEDFTVDHAVTAAEARQLFTRHDYAAVLLDLALPDTPGEELMKELLARRPNTRIVVVTANASIQRVVACMRDGASDYIVKPVQKERLIASLLLQRRRRSDPMAITARHELIGESPAMREVMERIRAVAPSRASVFITGESGTGKELCAELVHRLSPRGEKPFIAINCGAIPKDLMESEIFGHLKGSFTGAIADRDGAAMLADGGTLFLDEICEMDPALQTKLLRFLQTGLIQRVGSGHMQKVDVRIICATNRDPETEVREGRFREDLFYRLNVVPITMPPLQGRGEDVLQIAHHIIRQFCAEERKPLMKLSREAELRLMAHGWPGNVRELQNVLRRAIVFNPGERIEASMLEMTDEKPAARKAPRIDMEMDMRELWQIERDAIETAIARCDGSIPKAARILGVSPSTIYRKRESWAGQMPGSGMNLSRTMKKGRSCDRPFELSAGEEIRTRSWVPGSACRGTCPSSG